MPSVGRVCRLEYDFSGLLEDESKLYVRFDSTQGSLLRRSNGSLKLNMILRFELVQHADGPMATNLSPSYDKSRAQSVTQHCEARNCVDEPFRLAKQNLLFLRKEFESASDTNRENKVAALEQTLQILLTADELDGNAICELVWKAASWLAAPMAKLDLGSDHPMDQDAIRRLQMETQSRIRRIVIRALRCLDLQDPYTFSEVELVLRHLDSLIQRYESTKKSDITTARAGAQWTKLRHLLDAGGIVNLLGAVTLSSEQGDPDQNSELNEKQNLKRKRTRAEKDGQAQVVSCRSGASQSDQYGANEAKLDDKCFTCDPVRSERLPRSRWARTGGAFEPNERVKALSTVVHDPANAKTLQCSQCACTLLSSWFFKHPRSHRLAVLVPHQGHAACRKQYKKTCLFEAVDGSTCRIDNPSNIDFCEHRITRMKCLTCGGFSLCAHGKRPWNCKICPPASGRGKRFRRKTRHAS